jgi:2,5-diketo-D-gluconate reductase B
MFATSQQIGLGTFGNTDPEVCAEAVATGIDVGYRHLDTAQMYENEAAVGDGLARADVPREELFVATKVDPHNLAYDDVVESTERSLDRLGVDILDLLYVHWPNETYEVTETMAAFGELHDRGLIRHVGVSNFSPEETRAAQDACAAPIAVNQIELHPLHQQAALCDAMDDLGVGVVAYSPLARGNVFDVPVLAEIAADHDASVAQVCLAWLRANDVVPIPKATGRDHLVDNLGALSLDLSTAEIERIDDIERTERVVGEYGSWW